MEEAITKDEERQRMLDIVRDNYEKLLFLEKSADSLSQTLTTNPPMDGTMRGFSLVCKEARKQIGEVMEYLG